MGNLKKISEGDEDEDDEDEEEDEDGDPVISSAMVKHNGCVNRIRVCIKGPVFFLCDQGIFLLKSYRFYYFLLCDISFIHRK